MYKNINLDKIGFTTSFLCAIHCAVFPIIITSLSLTKLNWLMNPIIEICVIIFSFLIGTLSLIPAYLKYHNSIIPVITIITGFSVIMIGHMYLQEGLEHIVTPIGAMFIAIAHLINWKLKNHHCNCHHINKTIDIK